MSTRNNTLLVTLTGNGELNPVVELAKARKLFASGKREEAARILAAWELTEHETTGLLTGDIEAAVGKTSLVYEVE